ncbi:hypothetical protein BST27_17355 [Mycobacterium intermedium]|uniref:DUF7689 domain-containing protein n=1 Tax=Mycobacterium intermedium TaxID=28445 RepID=A0A1E3SFI8_MYCIE|nr:hypothetical protein [Mycobacterium intermedium]MCV6965974.1 hypothetical protein [Mycobacterium intermedium]ODR00348.1 hypothetical protein BHQ20_13405 [Mycobacterium intermedium]OPE51054.1 hypothetical protein BV508_07770 [Mycobacterium intermedium]ORB01772.1 hypothetical protein BST27_17355 [Mycobacterium intermedium]
MTYVDYPIDRLMSGPYSLGPRPGRYGYRAGTRGRIAEAMLETALPVLKRINYRIVLPKTEQYNCIAWAAGDQTRWWHPFAARAAGRRCAAHGLPDHCFWPLADYAHSMTTYIAAFETVGYRLCAFDPSPEPGIEKIALYQWPDLDGCSHAARQLPSGVWVSKVNDLPGIAHLRPSDLEGKQGYGQVVEYMFRRRPL